MPIIEIIIAGGGLIAGLLIGGAFGGRMPSGEQEFEKQQKEIVQKARNEAEKLKKAAEADIGKIKEQARQNNERMASQLERTEESLKLKEQQLERRNVRNGETETRISSEEETVELLKREIGEIGKNTAEKLAQKAKITRENLKKQIIEEHERELVKESKSKLENRIERLKDEGPRRAKEIIIQAINRYAAETSVDRRLRDIKVKRDDDKIRIVGENAENIKKLEELIPDVFIVFNDEPETISIYSFDLIQEHVARMAIKMLCRERDITPQKVEKTVEKARGDMVNIFREIGQKANERIGLSNPDPGLLEMIGRMFFRTSYGQNILKHSFEVASMARIIAEEIGADVETTWLGAFFHDIGKTIDKEPENEGIGHDHLSKRILEQYGFSEKIVDAAWRHHEAEPINSIEGQLVQAADAISAGRPGARSESLEQYLERIRLLETTAGSFPGIEKVYAISAGREVRLFVDPRQVNDARVQPLAGEIASKIEDELSYPGTIRINVIRKTKATDTAKRAA